MAYVAEQTALCTARQRDLSGAERGFREAIALLEKTSPDSSHLVRVLNEYADFLQDSKPIDAKANRLKARGIESRLVAKPAQP